MKLRTVLTDIIFITQIITVIDFLYNDIEGPTKASIRFLTLERIVSDFLFTCSNSGFHYGSNDNYRLNILNAIN